MSVACPLPPPPPAAGPLPGAQRGSPHLTALLCVFNEAGNLPELFAQLRRTLDPWLDRDYELLFVDDGSTDGSAELLDAEAAKDPRVLVVHFARNFGQHAAIAAGMAYARGEVLVLLDADLQDPPDQIPLLYAEYRKGFPMVFGLRKARSDGFARRLAGRAFFFVVNRVLGQRIPTNIATFRLFARPVVDAFNRLGERSRITGPLNHWLGFKCAYVEVEHRPRFQGESKYDLRALLRLTVWILTAFSYAPIRLATGIGLGFFCLGGGYALYTLVLTLVVGRGQPGFAALLAVITMFAGIQILLIGLVGEYVGRIYTEVQRRPLYLVERLLNLPGAPLDLEPGPWYDARRRTEPRKTEP